MKKSLIGLGILSLILVALWGCSFIKDIIKDKPITFTIGSDTTSITYSAITTGR